MEITNNDDLISTINQLSPSSFFYGEYSHWTGPNNYYIIIINHCPYGPDFLNLLLEHPRLLAIITSIPPSPSGIINVTRFFTTIYNNLKDFKGQLTSQLSAVNSQIRAFEKENNKLQEFINYNNDNPNTRQKFIDYERLSVLPTILEQFQLKKDKLNDNISKYVSRIEHYYCLLKIIRIYGIYVIDYKMGQFKVPGLRVSEQPQPMDELQDAQQAEGTCEASESDLEFQQRAEREMQEFLNDNVFNAVDHTKRIEESMIPINQFTIFKDCTQQQYSMQDSTQY